MYEFQIQYMKSAFKGLSNEAKLCRSSLCLSTNFHPYTWTKSPNRIPFKEDLNIAWRGSHLDEDSSEDSGNCNWRRQHIASWGHGLNFKNHWKAYHIILKCSTKIWPKTSDSTENSAPEFTKEIRQSCIQWQQCRSVRRRRQNHQIRWWTFTRIS